MRSQRFKAVLADGSRGGVFVAVPFDPDVVWLPKAQHHVGGTLNGIPARAVITGKDGVWGFTLGPAWLRDCGGLAIGDTVTVELTPEGPHREDLAEDIAAALDASPEAGAFFDSLAQFYRKAYLRWIDATTRRPEERARRIAEMVQLLGAGIRQRPKEGGQAGV